MRFHEFFIISFILIVFCSACDKNDNKQQANIHYLRGEKLQNELNWEKASIEFQKAIKKDVFLIKAHEKFQDVEFYYFNKKAKLIQYYKDLSEKYPNRSLFYYLLGRISDYTSFNTKDLFKKSIAVDSTFIPAYIELLDILLFFDEDFEESQKFLNDGLRINPNSIDLLNAKSKYLKKIGDIDNLEKNYNEIVEKFADSTNAVEAFEGLLSFVNETNKKIELLEHALLIAPYKLSIYNKLYSIYSETNHKKYLDLIQKAIRIKPPVEDRRVPGSGYISWFYYYAFIENDSLQAKEIANDVLNIRLNAPNLTSYIARSLINRGYGIDIAIKLLQKTLTINLPENYAGINCFGRISYTQCKKEAESQKAYILSDLGFGYFKIGNYTKAVESLNLASGVYDAAEYKIQNRLGMVYEKIGDLEKASSAYLKSLLKKEDGKTRSKLESISQNITGISINIPRKNEVNIDSIISKARVEKTELAPEVNLKTINTKSISISDFKGKIIILNFWASWCGPCIKELPFIQELTKIYAQNNSDVILLTINLDHSYDHLEEFLKANKYNFPVLLNKGVNISFGVKSIPTTIIIDKKGIIRYKNIGFNDEINFTELIQKEINLLLD
jgi:tetratricopeptide (TPR) repeat protein